MRRVEGSASRERIKYRFGALSFSQLVSTSVGLSCMDIYPARRQDGSIGITPNHANKSGPLSGRVDEANAV